MRPALLEEIRQIFADVSITPASTEPDTLGAEDLEKEFGDHYVAVGLTYEGIRRAEQEGEVDYASIARALTPYSIKPSEALEALKQLEARQWVSREGLWKNLRVLQSHAINLEELQP